MPRKSATALATVPVVNARARLPQPPANLTAAQLKIWQLVVDSLPAGYLTPEHGTSLALYCRHADRANRLADMIDRMDPSDDGYVKLSKLAIAESHHALCLGRALRINANTRTRPEVLSGRVSKHVQPEEKPWARVA